MREDSQKCVLKELMDLIGLMMLGGFFSSAVEFGEELEMSIKKKKKKSKAIISVIKSNAIIVHYVTQLSSMHPKMLIY